MSSSGRGSRDPGKGTIVKIVLAAIVCVVLLFLIVKLFQIVIINGSSLIKDAGERPVETIPAEEEDVWVPEVEPMATNTVEEVVAPRYEPEISESADFSKDSSEDGVPVTNLPEDPAPEDNLFDPEEFPEE